MNTVSESELKLQLIDQAANISKWTPTAPSQAMRCEQCRHRTLAHLRACQEQWLIALRAIARDRGAKITFLHPWRHFEAEHYENVAWAEHMEQYQADRKEWLALLEGADWECAGTWNRKPDTVRGLTERLAQHEAYHCRGGAD